MDGCAASARGLVFGDDINVIIKYDDIGFAVNIIVEGVVDAPLPIANVSCVWGQYRVLQDLAVPVEFEDSFDMGEIDGVVRTTGALDVSFQRGQGA